MSEGNLNRIYLTLLLILSFAYNISPQWTNQNPVPQGNHLWSTFFIDDNIGWIVGSEGFIKKTTDSGLNWVLQNSGTTLTLRSVQFIDPNTGWICGEAGIIIKTTDGGQNWFSLTSGTTELLTNLYLCNSNIGYIVGYNETIIKTTDGGINWIIQHSGSDYDLFSVDFLDAYIGYAVGGRDSSNFLKTTDGGINWIKKSLNLGALSTPILNCVEFTDFNTGWIGSEGQFYNHSNQISKTTDGGDTWSSTSLIESILKSETTLHIIQDNSLDIQKGIRSIYFKDSNNGYAVGGTYDGWNRCIYATTNSGETWQTKYAYSEQTGLLSVTVNANEKGFAVGYSGVIYNTNDNGSSWHQILSGNNKSYYSGDWITSIFMINDSVGWASGYRKGIWYYPILMKTTNGGKVWETIHEFGNCLTSVEANICFVNENLGWVSFFGKASYKTTDGGNSWVICGEMDYQKLFANQDTGWAASSSGIFKSTDGGFSWIQKSAFNSRNLYFTDPVNGWAVGAGGNILKSTDEGENWYLKVSGTNSNLNSVNFYDVNVGMCVGNSGTILITTDGGENWISENTGIVDKLNSVAHANSNSFWVVGANGTILNTTDLGNNWMSFDNLTTEDLNSVFFTNENTGWIGGSNGTILEYHEDILPVELQAFKAEAENSKVILNWNTATETNNRGFDIERKINGEEWTKIGFVAGSGNSSSPKSYSFIDEDLFGGSVFHYRLKQLSIDGSYEYFPQDGIEVEVVPAKFELEQNYPNPFNPSTTINFSLPKAAQLKINVYNMLGELVQTIAEGNYEAGYHKVDFNAGNLSSGAYIYRLENENFILTKKMILIK